MTARHTITFVTLTCLICSADASEVASSKQYSDCKDWPDTSSMFEGCVLNHETDDMEKEISALQKQILKYAPTASEQLQQAESAWELYLKQACAAQVTVMGGINGISSARCYNSLTKQRLNYLRDSF